MPHRSSRDQQTQDLRRRTPAPAEQRFDMSDEQPRAGGAVSYDQLARTTVPLPDSSYRPTQAEEELADVLTGLRIVTAWPDDEAASEADVRAALAAHPQLDTSDLRLVIHGATVAVEGSVASPRDRDELIAVLEDVPAVEHVVVPNLRIRAV